MPTPSHLKLITPSENQSGTTESEWAIRVQGLGKKFSIYTHDRNRLLEFFGNRKHHEEHWSLRNLNFQIHKGECFGIVGPNGAGKSTLLKMLSDITAPSEGTVELKGQLSTLLDLGVGFHPSFTGRENIKFNCKLLGMSDADIDLETPNILKFAELGEFIDFPVRTYSSGMQLRLGFSIAAHVPSDILLIDEVLAVGDQRFQRKCVSMMEQFLASGKTIVLVSHDLHAIRSLCNRVLWLNKGTLQLLGPAVETVDRYIQGSPGNAVNSVSVQRSEGETQHPTTMQYESSTSDPELEQNIRQHFNTQTISKSTGGLNPVDVVKDDQAIVQGTGEVTVERVQILDADAQPRLRFQTHEDILVAVTFSTHLPLINPIFGVAIFRSDDVYVHGPNSKFDQVFEGEYHGTFTFFIRWPNIPLLSGQYEVSIAIFDQHHIKPYCWHNRLYSFEIASQFEDHGLIKLKHDWGLLTHSDHNAPDEP